MQAVMHEILLLLCLVLSGILDLHFFIAGQPFKFIFSPWISFHTWFFNEENLCSRCKKDEKLGAWRFPGLLSSSLLSSECSLLVPVCVWVGFSSLKDLPPPGFEPRPSGFPF